MHRIVHKFANRNHVHEKMYQPHLIQLFRLVEVAAKVNQINYVLLGFLAM